MPQSLLSCCDTIPQTEQGAVDRSVFLTVLEGGNFKDEGHWSHSYGAGVGGGRAARGSSFA